MADALKTLLKQPYWILSLILGAFLVALPCVSIDKGLNWKPISPVTPYPLIVGCVLILVSFFVFGYHLVTRREISADGLDFTRVKEVGGALSTTIANCEIRVLEGRIEEYARGSDEVVVLPSNEYFDDECAHDPRSALGAFANRVFRGRIGEFVSLVKSEASRKFGEGQIHQKTETEWAISYGVGQCIMLPTPLGTPDPVALISTTTQRAGQGLSAQISCLFAGMHELRKCLADLRLNKVAMPVLGGGHGRLDPRLAFIGLLLAIAEAARYGPRLSSATIIVFKKDAHSPAEVDPIVVRRALALISAHEKA